MLKLTAIGYELSVFAEGESRRDGRVVEGGGLENRFPVIPGRGFESYSLR